MEIDVDPFMAPGPTSAATSGLPPRGDLAGRRHFVSVTGDGLRRRTRRVPYGAEQGRIHRAGEDEIGEPVTGDGNGWVHCSQGHRHWGRFGAAGLLVTDGARVVLQHRSEWTHEGGTWALPGGARDSHEDPVTAALREAAEEAALDPADVQPFHEWVDDHGGWSYTTVLARAVGPLQLAAVNFESTAIRWWELDEVVGLPLHAGFAAAWPSLHRLVAVGPAAGPW